MGHNGKDLINKLDPKSQENFFKEITGSRQNPNWNNGEIDRALNQLQQEKPSLWESLFGKKNKNNDKK